jgi:transcriptional regulator with XRE-family HTH domain
MAPPPAPHEHPGHDIRSARFARGWSQGELAQHSGVGVRTIRRVEAGEGDPDSRTITRLRHTLGLSGDPAADPRAVLRAMSDAEFVAFIATETARRLGTAHADVGLPEQDLRLPRRNARDKRESAEG